MGWLDKYKDGGGLKKFTTKNDLPAQDMDPAQAMEWRKMQERLNPLHESLTPFNQAISQSLQRQQQTTPIQNTKPESKFKKAVDIVRNPVTALEYKMKGQDIPDNFDKGSRNVYDQAVDVFNPMTYLDAAGRTLSLKHIREQGFTPEAIGATMLDGAMVAGVANEANNLITRNKFNLLPVESENISEHGTPVNQNFKENSYIGHINNEGEFTIGNKKTQNGLERIKKVEKPKLSQQVTDEIKKRYDTWQNYRKDLTDFTEQYPDVYKRPWLKEGESFTSNSGKVYTNTAGHSRSVVDIIKDEENYANHFRQRVGVENVNSNNPTTNPLLFSNIFQPYKQNTQESTNKFDTNQHQFPEVVNNSQQTTSAPKKKSTTKSQLTLENKQYETPRKDTTYQYIGIDRHGQQYYESPVMQNQLPEKEFDKNLWNAYDSVRRNKPKYKDGGKVQPFVTSDVNEYKKRKQAYDDSAALAYNSRLAEQDFLNKFSKTKFKEDPSNLELPSLSELWRDGKQMAPEIIKLFKEGTTENKDPQREVINLFSKTKPSNANETGITLDKNNKINRQISTGKYIPNSVANKRQLGDMIFSDDTKDFVQKDYDRIVNKSNSISEHEITPSRRYKHDDAGLTSSTMDPYPNNKTLFGSNKNLVKVTDVYAPSYNTFTHPTIHPAKTDNFNYDTGGSGTGSAHHVNRVKGEVQDPSSYNYDANEMYNVSFPIYEYPHQPVEYSKQSDKHYIKSIPTKGFNSAQNNQQLFPRQQPQVDTHISQPAGAPMYNTINNGGDFIGYNTQYLSPQIGSYTPEQIQAVKNAGKFQEYGDGGVVDNTGHAPVQIYDKHLQPKQTYINNDTIPSKIKEYIHDDRETAASIDKWVNRLDNGINAAFILEAPIKNTVNSIGKKLMKSTAKEASPFVDEIVSSDFYPKNGRYYEQKVITDPSIKMITEPGPLVPLIKQPFSPFVESANSNSIKSLKAEKQPWLKGKLEKEAPLSKEEEIWNSFKNLGKKQMGGVISSRTENNWLNKYK